jgi:hypothetical protein
VTCQSPSIRRSTRRRTFADGLGITSKLVMRVRFSSPAPTVKPSTGSAGVLRSQTHTSQGSSSSSWSIQNSRCASAQSCASSSESALPCVSCSWQYQSQPCWVSGQTSLIALSCSGLSGESGLTRAASDRRAGTNRTAPVGRAKVGPLLPVSDGHQQRTPPSACPASGGRTRSPPVRVTSVCVG